MAIVEFPILMNEYTVWLDKPDNYFNLDVWEAEYQLKELAWWNEDILYLIEEFVGGSMSISLALSVEFV